MNTEFRVRPFESRVALNDALAERLAREIDQAARGPVALMLSGGHTPLQAYQALATRTFTPSSSLEIFYSDDRYVPPASDASNFRATRALLEALALPAEHVHRVRTELPLDRAVEDYEQQLRALLQANTRITVGLLGLGADGHTASLFSEAHLQRATGKLAIGVQRPDGLAGVSVTPELLAHIEEVLFIVAGADKRAALKAFVERAPDSVAARAVASCHNVEVWADRDAWPPASPQPDPS
ncbi:MAG: 6-phosphogluconolactonase [Steroidobacteraceae bacterium]|nr:6-phosphogluconolactonase [Steroidobacteraceae bacterium]